MGRRPDSGPNLGEYCRPAPVEQLARLQLGLGFELRPPVAERLSEIP
jgi:hypothetical protein